MAKEGENNLTSLLKAEEEANRIIRKAEDLRDSMRLAAQDQAKNEIAQLRAQMEKDYLAKQAAAFGDDSAIAKKTAEAIQLHQGEYDQNKATVVKMLVERIMYVRYEVPRNVKADFSVLKQQDDSN